MIFTQYENNFKGSVKLWYLKCQYEVVAELKLLLNLRNSGNVEDCNYNSTFY